MLARCRRGFDTNQWQKRAFACQQTSERDPHSSESCKTPPNSGKVDLSVGMCTLAWRYHDELGGVHTSSGTWSILSILSSILVRFL